VVSGRPKNLIFTSRGPKPKIGFVDAINNDIIILSGEDSCLVYDRPISSVIYPAGPFMSHQVQRVGSSLAALPFRMCSMKALNARVDCRDGG
jgi:hypothetical protein